MKERKEINVQMGGRVRLARQTAGFTQEKLAEMVDVSVQFISDFERGVVGISIPRLVGICKALCVSSDYILTGKTESNDTSAVMDRLSHLSAEQYKIVESGINVILEAFATPAGK